MIPCYITYILTKSTNTGASITDLLLYLLQITTIVKEKMTRSKESSHPRLPLELSGALDSFHFEESTPTIGREYFDVDIVKDILEAENEEALIRDLAITSELREKILSSGANDKCISLAAWCCVFPLSGQLDERQAEGAD